MRLHRKSQLGMSLIELLIATAISAMIGLVIVMIFSQNSSLFINQTNKVNQGVDLNDAYSVISTDIKESASVVTGYPVGSPTFVTSNSILVLSMPAVNASGNIIENVYDYEILAADTQKPAVLRKLVYANAQSARKSVNQVLLTNLASIHFSFLNNAGSGVAATTAQKINFYITVTNRNGFENQVSSVSAEMRLRNSN